MAASGGAFAESSGLLKVLNLLAEACTFQLGGILIGTPAFAAYSNLLESAVFRGEPAHPGHRLGSGDRNCPCRAMSNPLGSVRYWSLASRPSCRIPGLNPRRPSTSFKVRGKELRVDFLTSMRGRESGSSDLPSSVRRSRRSRCACSTT